MCSLHSEPLRVSEIQSDSMDTDAITISIVIVTWNCKAYASECLKSLDRQLHRFPTELIVVDNASSDGTPELIAADFPHVRLIKSNRNLGFAKGNNVGISASRGKYVCLINPDVIVTADCLGKLVDYMECEPTVGLLGPKMLDPAGRIARSTMRFPTLWNSLCRALALDAIFKRSPTFGGYLMRDFQHDEERDVEILNGWFWMARRSAMEEVGVLDEQLFMYGDDLDWCRRFHTHGWRVVFYAQAEAIHYGGGSSVNAPIPCYLAMQRANLQYWKKHKGGFLTMSFFIVTCLHHLARILGYGVIFTAKPGSRSEASAKLRRSSFALFWLIGLGSSRIREVR